MTVSPAPARVMFIAGPTASGKTGLALDLAEAWDAIIVNADSMQVYRDLSVLTARPTPDETARAPHHLFGHVDAGVRHSVGVWSREARAVLAQADQPAILVGGTGLYFRALTDGLAPTPPISSDAEREADAVLAEHGVDGLRARAEALDPEAAAAVLGADRSRLLRIVGVALTGEGTLSQWRADTRPPEEARGWRGLVLDPPRETLNARIAVRADRMLTGGGVEEAMALAARGLDPALPAMKALGVAAACALGRGALTFEEALERVTIETRQYAKRQRTWFRNQTADWARIADPSAAEAGAALAR